MGTGVRAGNPRPVTAKGKAFAMTTQNLNTLLLASAISVWGATAHAQPDPMATKCQFSLCVYDDRGEIVGVENSIGQGNVVQRYMSGNWYQLNYSTSLGFDVNAILLYEQLGCLGQPYFNTGYEIGPADHIHPNAMRLTSPAPAAFDGYGVIWGPIGPSGLVDVKSFRYEDICSSGSWGGTPQVAAPAFKLDTRSLPAPWKIH